MPRYPDAEREKAQLETRRKLLEAATKEFAEKGFDKANVDRISQAAGFAKGTIYNYFENKRAIMLALIEEFSSAHVAYLTEEVHQEVNADRRMERFFKAGFDFVVQHLAQGRVVVNNLYGSDEEFKLAMYHAYAPMFALVGEEILALGISQGLFRQFDPASTAGIVMNIYLGVSWQIDRNGTTMITHEQVADFILNGLRVKV
ncbi:MAG: TetR/AcrR family transcriptional regulator [Anaerolineales bacterium]|jgi:AcrR family transcriptional regulator